MIEQILSLHSQLKEDECMKVVLTREGYDLLIYKEDRVNQFNNCLYVLRENHRTVIINPDCIVMTCTIPRRRYL